jgi:hypothetical protein
LLLSSLRLNSPVNTTLFYSPTPIHSFFNYRRAILLFRQLHQSNFPNLQQTIKMKFTTVVATILSMAVFAIAAPVSTGMFDPRNTLSLQDIDRKLTLKQRLMPVRTTACASRALLARLSRSPTARLYDTPALEA